MRRILLAPIILLSSIIMFSSTAMAATNIIPDCNPGGSAYNTPVCQDVQSQSNSSGNLVVQIITDVINVLSVLVGAVAVIMIIISGIRMVTSSGNPDAVSGARSNLFAALIGIAIVVLAQTIVIFVLNNIK